MPEMLPDTSGFLERKRAAALRDLLAVLPLLGPSVPYAAAYLAAGALRRLAARLNKRG